MVVIGKSQLKSISTQFSLIGSKYQGKISKHSEIVKDLINQHEKELMIKDKELMKQQYEKELMKSKIEH